jgi:Flp pilus assembly protein CpaB
MLLSKIKVVFKMNRLGLIFRQKIFIIVFVLLALFGGLVIYWYISRQENTSTGSDSCELILTASCDIGEGTEITEDMLAYEEIPYHIYSEKFITSKEDLLGKKTLAFIPEGEIISIENIEESQRLQENYLRFSSHIPAGQRAVSIPVNYYGDTLLLSCGDTVDVISTYYDRENGLLMSDTVLNGKEVILIGDNGEEKIHADGMDIPVSTGEINMLGEMFGGNDVDVDSSLTVITLYLNPEEVERIFLAMESGVLNISICPGIRLPGH